MKAELAILRLIHEYQTNQVMLNASASFGFKQQRIVYEENVTKTLRDPSASFVMVNTSLPPVKFQNKGSYELVYQIQWELLVRNPLWRFNHLGKSQTRKALKELESHGYIVPIYGTDIFYVNPGKISNGNGNLVIYSLSYHLYTKRKTYAKIDTSDVIPLKKPPQGYQPPELDSIQIFNLYN